MIWYSKPGGFHPGFSQRVSYLGWLDQVEGGAALATGPDATTDNRLQAWFRLENPYLGVLSRPAVGWSAGVARLDDVLKANIGRRRERSDASHSRLNEISVAYTVTQGQDLLPEGWLGNASAWSADMALRSRFQWGPPEASYSFLESRVVAGGCGRCAYAKLEGSAGSVSILSEHTRFAMRAYGGTAQSDRAVPGQRALYVSVEDPVSTFGNHWWRPRESILKQPNVNWLPLGGAALRGYHWSVSSAHLVAANLELSRRVGELSGDFGALSVWLAAFVDAGYDDNELVDAGAGINVRGRLFDQPVNLRLDLPVFVSHPASAIGRATARRDPFAARWVITFDDIW